MKHWFIKPAFLLFSPKVLAFNKTLRKKKKIQIFLVQFLKQ